MIAVHQSPAVLQVLLRRFLPWLTWTPGSQTRFSILTSALAPAAIVVGAAAWGSQNWWQALAETCGLGAGLLVVYRVRRRNSDVLPGQDRLTRLPNRHGLSAWIGGLADRGPVSLVAVDVEGLRLLNEEFGYDAGDSVLRWVAHQLSHFQRAGGLVARVHGDVFAVAVTGSRAGAVAQLGLDVRRALQRSMVHQGRRLHVSVNVAVVTEHQAGPPAGHNDGMASSRADHLLRCAALTMVDARALTASLAVHDVARCARSPKASVLDLVDDMHRALEGGGELEVWLQPQHTLTGGVVGVATLTGCEALIRWRHPDRGLLGPADVLRAVEVGHLQPALRAAVIDLALQAASRWWRVRELPVAVNVTAADLQDPQLPTEIAAALNKWGLPAAALVVEVVEDTVMTAPHEAAATLGALRRLGVGVALDDYGTGYSSLAYLHRLPIDEVKLDRTLVAGIARDEAAAAIVRHSTNLAHALGLRVLVEGVETAEDLECARQLGCDSVQGYLTGRPMSVSEWVSQISPELESGSRTGRAVDPGCHLRLRNVG